MLSNVGLGDAAISEFLKRQGRQSSMVSGTAGTRLRGPEKHPKSQASSQICNILQNISQMFSKNRTSCNIDIIEHSIVQNTMFEYDTVYHDVTTKPDSWSLVGSPVALEGSQGRRSLTASRGLRWQPCLGGFVDSVCGECLAFLVWPVVRIWLANT